MPRKLIEDFEGKEISTLCVAAKLSEASRIESALDNEQVDYAVDVAPIVGSMVVGEREGILFMVLSGQLHYCSNLLKKAGLSYLLTKEK